MARSSIQRPALVLSFLTVTGVSAALLLAGCASPRYQRPDVPAPPGYRGDAAAPTVPGATNNGEPGSLGELRWQDLIRDEELVKLIQEALAQNFDAQIAAARVLEARAQLTVSRSARLPSIEGSANYNNLRAAGIDSDYSYLNVSLGWELDLWGRIRNTSAAARAALLAGEQARRVVLQTLVSDVASAYFLLRDLDLELEITQRELKLREDSRDLVQLRVDNGYSSGIELQQAEVLVKSARAALISLELQREQTENQLAVLLGRNPGPIVRGRSLVEQGLVASLPPGLPSTLLDRRPDIRQAEQQLIGDHALVAVAKAAFFPTISLTASGGIESPALLNLFKTSTGMWYFAPAGSLPIFHAGAIRAGVRGAEARRQQSLLAYQKTVQQAFREVADSLASSRKLAELRTQQEGLVESLQQGVDLADLAYKGGVVSYLEYLDSERQLLDARLQLVQIRRQELTNIVTLYRALGGGWQ
jgi:NodT family efflux transporter outer membrane factor (OMF) lipoprotein